MIEYQHHFIGRNFRGKSTGPDRKKWIPLVDQEKIRQAMVLYLEGIGEDPTREGLRETPDRIARMCEEIYAGMDTTADEHLSRRFSVSGNELVVEKDITFYSMCEHHLLPFFGKAHIAYVPDGQVVGLSKLARTVGVYARRPQIQERLTTQIADEIMEQLCPQGVMVVLEAEHLCMSMRGVCKPGTTTMTMAARGCFVDNDALQARFFRLLQR